MSNQPLAVNVDQQTWDTDPWTEQDIIEYMARLEGHEDKELLVFLETGINI